MRCRRNCDRQLGLLSDPNPPELRHRNSSSDDFVRALLEPSTEFVLQAVKTHRVSLKYPSKAPEKFLAETQRSRAIKERERAS